jgi:electron transfer flavoprotein beta subunit
MKILVCIKQVPDVDALTVFETADGRANMEEAAAFHMNRYDECAVEAAIRIREEFSPAADVFVDALTAGPDRTLAVIRRAIGMGAQAGIHLRSGEDTAGDPAAVAAGIARYARPESYDLILTGTLSEDGMHGQVGPRLAAHLDWPCAIDVVGMELDPDRGVVRIEKEVENGIRRKLELRLPAVLALQSGINRPRYPSLSNLLRANRQPVHTVDLAAGDSASSVDPLYTGIFMPRRVRAGKVLEGTPEEKARALTTILRERAFFA